MDSKNFYENLTEYLNVIKAFKKRYDVQNGFALGYRINQDPNGELLMKNKPHSIGEGITTMVPGRWLTVMIRSIPSPVLMVIVPV